MVYFLFIFFVYTNVIGTDDPINYKLRSAAMLRRTDGMEMQVL